MAFMGLAHVHPFLFAHDTDLSVHVGESSLKTGSVDEKCVLFFRTYLFDVTYLWSLVRFVRDS
jgi:hypothetical protein